MCTGPCSAPLSANSIVPIHDESIMNDEKHEHAGKLV